MVGLNRCVGCGGCRVRVRLKPSVAVQSCPSCSNEPLTDWNQPMREAFTAVQHAATEFTPLPNAARDAAAPRPWRTPDGCVHPAVVIMCARPHHRCASRGVLTYA